MGFKTFWANPETPVLAKKAIGIQYLQLQVTPEENEKAVVTFEMVMSQLVKRAMLLGVDLV
jgi:hypothetical protein